MSLAVFDLNGLVHWAWHGSPHGASEIVMKRVARVIVAHKPTYVAAAVDRPGYSFRKQLAPHYKANKERLPQDGPERASVLRHLVTTEELLEDLLGVRTFGALGFEADDVVASLVRVAQAEDMRTLIVAKDKDFCQLIDFDVEMLDWTSGAVTRPKDVRDKYSVDPAQFADYLAIVGDSSDNVPGVYGCGPVAARSVLNQFGTLEAALLSAESERGHPYWQEHGKTWARLAGSRAVAELARTLVTLRKDVPLGIAALEELRFDVDVLAAGAAARLLGATDAADWAPL